MTKLNIKNCLRCNKIFIPVSGEKICPDCRAEDLALEERVKSYVRDHPGITVNQLIEGSGAPRNLVWRMIQQGQFENSGLKDAKYPCSNCGKIITRGTYCSECMEKLKMNAQKFANAMNSKKRAAEKKAQEQSANKTFSDSMYDALDNSRNR
ncbi:MAG: hypothetical protein IKO74_06820 [Selenomonadaceae bacterium]|nr:hypothetical protein [Selenomonadaceae bacterium]